MHLQDLLTPANIGQSDHNLTVKTARAQQRGVEHVGAVCGGDNDDTVIHFEAVHLHQQLVECLFALVVPATQACAAMTAYRVDFVDEDDARRLLFRLVKHVAHTGGAHADKHLHEI